MSDDLLHAMSIETSLSLDQFYHRFRTVYHPVRAQDHDEDWRDVNLRRQVMRSLEALGYCEIDYANRRVLMLPPTMILLPSTGAASALLTGARVPETVRRLREAVHQAGHRARPIRLPQGRGNINMPARIAIEAVDRETIAVIAQKAGIAADLDQPAAWKLAHFSADADGIRELLAFETRNEPNWPRRIFNEDRIRFTKVQASDGRATWLAEYRNPTNKQLRHWLWRGAAAATVDRDWGRYLVLAESGKRVLLWDERTRQLAVPVTTPLPLLLARAATLSTGRLPTAGTTTTTAGSISKGTPMLVYEELPPQIVQTVAAKLNQDLMPTTVQEIVDEMDGQ